MGNFKKLRVWEDGVNLAANIYFVTRKKPFVHDYGLCGQIQKAAVSIVSNIAEGDERSTDKEAIYFFNVAKGSSAEVITQLHIAHKIGYLTDENFQKLEDQTEKIRASLKNLIKSKKNKEIQ